MANKQENESPLAKRARLRREGKTEDEARDESTKTPEGAKKPEEVRVVPVIGGAQ